MEHGLKDHAFYVQKHVAHRIACYNFPLVHGKSLEAPAFVKLIYWSCQGTTQYIKAWTMCIFLNTLRLRQNGRHFPDNTFRPIFLNENIRISIEISLKFVPKVPINNIPALVQIMAWRRPGDKPLSEPMMVCLLTHKCVTRPQWVKVFPCGYGINNVLCEELNGSKYILMANVLSAKYFSFDISLMLTKAADSLQYQLPCYLPIKSQDLMLHNFNNPTLWNRLFWSHVFLTWSAVKQPLLKSIINS